MSAAGDAAPELPPAAAAQPDATFLWWRRGFDAACSEQDEQVRKATADVITGAEKRVAAAELACHKARAESEATRAEIEKMKDMLWHVCHEYVRMSDHRRECAERDAARERARASRAEVGQRQHVRPTKRPSLTGVLKCMMTMR